MAPNRMHDGGDGSRGSGGIAAAAFTISAVAAAAVGSYVASLRRPDESLPQTVTRLATSTIGSATSWLRRSFEEADNAAAAARLRDQSPTLTELKKILGSEEVES